MVLAVGLLEHGDKAGWDFLVDYSFKAADHSAGWAAETVKKHDTALWPEADGVHPRPRHKLPGAMGHGGEDRQGQ